MIVEENSQLGDNKRQAGQGADRRTYDGRESNMSLMVCERFSVWVS